MVVLQSGSKKVTLICLDVKEEYDFHVTITPQGFHLNEKYLALWDNQQVRNIKFEFILFLSICFE